MDILVRIRTELKEIADAEYKLGIQRYFKEPIKVYGVRTPTVRKIAAKYFMEIKDLEKDEILDLCEQLLKGLNEESTIAFAWAYRLRDHFEVSDFDRFESWLKKSVDNWGKCDDFCTHTITYFVINFPELIPRIKNWAHSKNRWVKRAAAVSFITSKGRYMIWDKTLPDVFEVAGILLLDQDDLVQKGYGWMLKAASVTHQKEVFDFVCRHKANMPRTALRYAIEHMPQEMRKVAMSK